MTRRVEILKIINTIPSLPTIAVEIQQLLRTKELDVKVLADKIKYDPGLTANILSLANSAYFSFNHAVNTITDAIVLMGTKRVYELILAESLAPIVHKSIKGYDLPAGKLWEHSVAVAVACEELTKALEIKGTEYVFTAGLLHNVGKIVLGTFVEIEAKPILNLALQQGVSFDEAEKEILGIDHAEVGGILLENWKLPDHFINVAKYHHKPHLFPDGENILIDLVHTADALVMMSGLGTGADGLNYRVDQNVMDRLNLKKVMAEKIIANVMVELENLTFLLKQ
ncbi:HDOD domain-containing protein [bacterium]|nr:HDOD domain-containing protein [bacterium]